MMPQSNREESIPSLEGSVRRLRLGASGAGTLRMTTLIRVHVLDGGPDKAVGLELVAKSFASYQMIPITLSTREARDLVRHLQSAVGEVGP